MELLICKEISIVSTDDEIKILAKKRVTINSGRSYINLGINVVEQATQGSSGLEQGITPVRKKSRNITEIISSINGGDKNIFQRKNSLKKIKGF